MYSIPLNGDFDSSLNHEWLLTNGLGGFSSSSILGCNMRKYHGLLVAAQRPPVERIMTVNRIGEILYLDGHRDRMLELSINEFEGNFHPRGDRFLRRVTIGDVIEWEFDVDGVYVRKELLLVWNQNLAAVRYTIDSGKREFEFEAFPFISLRDFHAVRSAEGSTFAIETTEQSVQLRDGVNVTTIQADADFVRQESWWYRHVYRIERERGVSDSEDLFTPGRFEIRGHGYKQLTLWIGLESIPVVDWNQEVATRAALDDCAKGSLRKKSDTICKLEQAANDFVVYRHNPDGSKGQSVIAGYPWFADWGRDTMISLPGLFLTTGRFDQARQVLSVFARYVSEGMIPNRFDDYTNEPHYNTVDASLWFIHACDQYCKASGDNDTWHDVLKPACKAIIAGYMGGTRGHIGMDPSDGLISQGDESTQLTWMDAYTDGIAHTPRQGKPVEINALWYHALCILGEKDLAEQVRANFAKQFWIDESRGLADVVDHGRRDESIRPNQIFAVSLPNSPLAIEQQRAVVEVVQRELLTPVGLRTLAVSDPKYQSRYYGGLKERDSAYHNGTVWPWLMGAFLDAYLRVNENSPDAKAQATSWLRPLLNHMEREACIGQISEVFDATPPHRPGGCPAQAWSVAEMLRLAVALGM